MVKRETCAARYIYIHFKIGDARAVTIFFFGWRDAALHTPCRIHWIYIYAYDKNMLFPQLLMQWHPHHTRNCARILNYWYERAAAPKRPRVRFQRARVLLVADYIYTYLYVVSGPKPWTCSRFNCFNMEYCQLNNYFAIIPFSHLSLFPEQFQQMILRTDFDGSILLKIYQVS